MARTTIPDDPHSPATRGIEPPPLALSAEPPIQVTDLVKHFGTLVAVDGISLALRPGECLGLLGPNGAGKSTLLRCVAGRLVPDAGSVRVAGAPAGSAEARRALGWVPQDLAVYPRLSVRENLEAFGRYHGLRGPALRTALERCLGWAALTDRVDDLAGRLSGGMKRRLNLAAGLVHGPRVMILDEPTVGVDPQSRNRIFEMIGALRADGLSVIYTTHYMEEAERLCDRIAIVDHGRVIAQGSRDELVRGVFGAGSEVLFRFEPSNDGTAAFCRARGAPLEGGVARFTVGHPSEVAGLVGAAAEDGQEIVDLALRRPNLESVFLHLTGRELRE